VASYKVFIKPSAARELEAIGSREQRQRVVQRIRALANGPRPHGSEKLSSRRGIFRIRVGSYRVIYQVEDDSTEIHVVKVGHRRDVYR